MGGRGAKGGPGPGAGKASWRRKAAAGIGSSGSAAGSSSGGGKGTASASTGSVITGGGSGASGSGGTSTPTRLERAKKLVFATAKQGRIWASSIWPGKDKYLVQIRSEYSRYSTNTGYQSINTALRNIQGDTNKLNDPSFVLLDRFGHPMDKAEIADRIQRMDDGMSFAPAVPNWVEVSRGTRWQEFAQLGITSENDDLTSLEGRRYINDSYTSTSLGGKSAMSYMPIQLSVSVPPGIRAVSMAGDVSYKGALSTLPSENEFLLARGTQFKIKSVKKENGAWKIEVEALLP